MSAAETAIEDTRDAIFHVLGFHSFLFRAPYGHRTHRVDDYLAEQGYTHVLWDIDSRDFLSRSAELLRRRVSRTIIEREGGVILFHDTKVVTMQALPDILDDLEAENCARLDNEKPLIVPVTLHYMAESRDGRPRALPAPVRDRSERYQASLPERCEKRKKRQKEPRTAGITPEITLASSGL